MRSIYLSCLLLSILLIGSLSSCIKLVQDQTSTKQITAFALELPTGTPIDTSLVTVNIGTDSIHITVPVGINLDGLIPTITTTGAEINPANGAPQNFTNPVTYLVTAQDGTSQTYVVVVAQ